MVSLRPYWRFVLVVRQFLPLILSYLRDRNRYILFGRGREVTSASRVRRAERLLDSFLTLGPTFIKLGQLLSTRPDILPPEYIDVLASLQDDVPPAPWADARTVIEAEFGSIEERFDAFETEAISGASLGQVYRAEVDGEPVAVKVRRPGIEDLVEADLRVIRWTIPIIVRLVDESRAFSLQNLTDEFAETIREEMDYVREARMLQEIRGNLMDNDDVRIPSVLESHSGPRVMTMEYVGGTKITRVRELDNLGLDRSALAETLQRTYLEMIIEHGVFHADPHPGNLAVQPDGTIVFYDFGMSDRVKPYVQESVVDFYVAVANRDIDGILDTLIAMGTLSPDADREIMGEVMQLAIEDARGHDIEQYRVQRILQQVEDTIYEFPFRLPRDLALVMRVATVVEGVCVTLDPEFDFITVATDYLAEHGYREESARQVVEDIGDDVRRATRASIRIPPKLEDVLRKADRGDIKVTAKLRDPDDLLDRLAHRLILGMVLAALLVSAWVTYPDDPAPAGGALLLSLVVAVLLYRSFTKRRGVRTQAQFTRQAMRSRERAGDTDLEPNAGAKSGEPSLGSGAGIEPERDEE